MELKLTECEKKKDYVIKRIVVSDEEVKHRLKCFGFFIKEKIKLLNYNYGKTCYLVKVMGVNYVIDKKICNDIIVEI